MQKWIRCTGYVSAAFSLYFFVRTVIYLIGFVYDLVMQKPITYILNIVACLSITVVTGLIMLGTIELDIWLEDRARRKKDEKTYTDCMSQYDTDNS